MTETIFNVLKIGGLFLTIGGFVVTVWYLTGVLMTWAEKNKGSKISQRVFDAVEKLKMVTAILTGNAFNTLSKEAQVALADGVVTNEEVSTIIEKVTKDVITTLKPELPTLTKYFLGEGLESFVKNLVQKYIIDYAKEKLGFTKNLPLTK